MKKLYHGSIYVFETIDLQKGKGYKDFGKGFYATAIQRHADSIAKRNKQIAEQKEETIRRKNKAYKKKIYYPYRYNLEFDDSCLTDGSLEVLIFEKADIEWVKFILANRKSSKTTHNYDIVIGPTADENTTTIINNYKEELIRSDYSNKVLERLIRELQPENLPKQYFFGTDRALKYLKFARIRKEIVS